MSEEKQAIIEAFKATLNEENQSAVVLGVTLNFVIVEYADAIFTVQYKTKDTYIFGDWNQIP